MVRAEKLLSPLNGEGLNDINILAPSVPSSSRITLGIFIGEA
jgi:hypothetical protein